MLRTLLESRRRATRTPGSVAVSVVLHAGVVLVAAVATARGTPAPAAPPSDVIHFAPTPAPVEPTPRPAAAPAATPATTAGSAPAAPAAPADLLALPVPQVEVPDGIPPVDLGARVTDPADFATGLGRSRPGGDGGPGEVLGEGDIGAAPLDAAMVEEPVRALPGAPRPRYPEPLRSAAVAGRVTMEFVVDTAGRAEPGSLVVREEGHPLLAAEVRRVVLATRYRPARVGGRAVRQRVVQAFAFEVR
jgi:protein TonB